MNLRTVRNLKIKKGTDIKQHKELIKVDKIRKNIMNKLPDHRDYK